MTTLELLKIQIELVIELSGMQGPGATLLRSALKAVEDEQRWIPVEENSMPEEDRMILVADSKGQVSSAMFHAKSQSFTVYRFCGGNDDFLGQQIVGVLDFPTHWRPLPKGPEEIKGKTTP